jgi:type IVB pilus formation R64 PilN family outer membrane protein
MTFLLKPICLGLITSMVITGCSISQFEVNKLTNQRIEESDKQISRVKTQMKQEASLTRMSSNYFGDTPIDLPYAATLPPAFFEKVIIRQRGSNYGTVEMAAKNITLATGIATRVNPDVSMTGALAGGANPTGGLQSAVVPGAVPGGYGIPLGQALPGSKGGTVLTTGPGGINNNQNSIAVNSRMDNMQINAATLQAKNVVRLDYQGQLINYLNQVATSAGINWEWREGEGIYFFRMITKTFSLNNANAGETTSSDSVGKSGTSTMGSTGAANTQSSGVSGSAATVSNTASYSVWKMLKPALDAAITSAGKISINEATGTITVTDTKDSVERVRKIIEHENDLLGRQVAIEVRIIKVSINNASQLGVNLDAIYTSLVGNTLALVSPAALTTSSAGTATFTVNNTNSRWNGSTGAVAGLSNFGKIASDQTYNLNTVNRVPVMNSAFNTTGYLAQTTASSGGATVSGVGVPGLTPGSVTTGAFIKVTPTIKDNNTVFMSLSIDLSNLLGIGSATTGSGQTLQQIQWANTDGTKQSANILVGQDESMVMMGISTDSVQSSTNLGFTGGSGTAAKDRELYVVVVSPRILRGI